MKSFGIFKYTSLYCWQFLQYALSECAHFPVARLMRTTSDVFLAACTSSTSIMRWLLSLVLASFLIIDWLKVQKYNNTRTQKSLLVNKLKMVNKHTIYQYLWNTAEEDNNCMKCSSVPWTWHGKHLMAPLSANRLPLEIGYTMSSTELLCTLKIVSWMFNSPRKAFLMFSTQCQCCKTCSLHLAETASVAACSWTATSLGPSSCPKWRIVPCIVPCSSGLSLCFPDHCWAWEVLLFNGQNYLIYEWFY